MLLHLNILDERSSLLNVIRKRAVASAECDLGAHSGDLRRSALEGAVMVLKQHLEAAKEEREG